MPIEWGTYVVGAGFLKFLMQVNMSIGEINSDIFLIVRDIAH